VAIKSETAFPKTRADNVRMLLRYNLDVLQSKHTATVQFAFGNVVDVNTFPIDRYRSILPLSLIATSTFVSVDQKRHSKQSFGRGPHKTIGCPGAPIDRSTIDPSVLATAKTEHEKFTAIKTASATRSGFAIGANFCSNCERSIVKKYGRPPEMHANVDPR
jgi:hypothetical protein